MPVTRRSLLKMAGAAVAVPIGEAAAQPAPAAPAPFELAGATVADLQAAMTSGQRTAVTIAQAYLARIDAVDRAGPAITAMIELNPDALAIAEALDRERREKGARGPLHGIPVVLKDNVDTADRMGAIWDSEKTSGTWM